MGKLDVEAFMRVNLPAIESDFPFHDWSFILMRLIMRSQDSIRFTLPPIGRPRYVKGSFITLHKREFNTDCNHPSSK